MPIIIWQYKRLTNPKINPKCHFKASDLCMDKMIFYLVTFIIIFIPTHVFIIIFTKWTGWHPFGPLITCCNIMCISHLQPLQQWISSLKVYFKAQYHTNMKLLGQILPLIILEDNSNTKQNNFNVFCPCYGHTIHGEYVQQLYPSIFCHHAQLQPFSMYSKSWAQKQEK